MKQILLPLILAACFLTNFSPRPTLPETGGEEFIRFRFKGKQVDLSERIRTLPEDCWGSWCQTNEQLDTLCNIYLFDKKRVKIIRQNDGFDPETGIGLLFQFDPATDSLPYLSPSARLQLIDFQFGGARGTQTDRANYTGVTNDVSSDLKLSIEKIAGDTLIGSFSGVLVNGAGGMSPIEDGEFRIRVFSLKI